MFIISLQNNVLIFLFPQVWAQKDQSQEKNFKSIVWWNISFWGKKLTVEWKEIFTSAEREVKDSRRSGMYQSCNFLTRLGKQSL